MSELIHRMSEIFHTFVDWIVEIVSSLGHFGVFILMALESSFFPFPSEVVLIPAGYLAKAGEMNLGMIIFAGVAGSLLGATINYYLSLWLGRRFIVSYGKYFLLPEEKFLKLEQAFLEHGKFATFVGRLIFGIRQWISIPAGISRMPFLPFAFLTSLGAGIWVTILVALGYVLGESENTFQTAKLVGMWLLGVIVIMSLAYWYWWKPKKQSAGAPSGG